MAGVSDYCRLITDPGTSTRPGYVCHECPDHIRIAKNCRLPLRTRDYTDTRDQSQPSRCAVDGRDKRGGPHPHYRGEVVEAVKLVLRLSAWIERADLDDVPADLWSLWRVVDYERRLGMDHWAREADRRRSATDGNHDRATTIRGRR